MRTPAAIPAIGLLAGASAGIHLHPDVAVVRVVLVVGCACAFVAFMLRAPRTLVAALAVGFVSGGTILGTVADRNATHSSLRGAFDHAMGREAARSEPHEVIARVRQDAFPTPYGAAMDLMVERVRLGGRWHDVRGGVRASVNGARASAACTEWTAGRVVRLFMSLRRPPPYRNFGTPDQEIASARRGAVLIGSAKSAALVQVEQRGSHLAEGAARIRRVVAERLDASVGRWAKQSAGVAIAIAIGNRAGLDADLERRLQVAGTFHVIAISGGNVAVFTTLSVFVLRWIGVSARTAAALAVVVVLAYGTIVYGSASVARAVTVACTYLAARAVDHRTSGLNALSLAAALAVVAAPMTVVDAGFALSFGATTGIILCASRVHRWLAGSSVLKLRVAEETVWRRIAHAAATVLAATFAAEIALLPVGAYVFSRITFAGLVLNLIAIPLMAIVQIGSLVTVAVSGVLPLLTWVTGWITHVAVRLMLSSAALVEWMPWLAARVPPPPLWVVAVYYAAIWAAVFSARSVARLSGAAGGLLCAAAMWVGQPVAATRTGTSMAGTRTMQVLFLDVGQGDSTLVRSGGDAMLIDAGGVTGRFNAGERIVSPALWAAGIRRLDVLAISHGDPDHAGGGRAVYEDLHPREIWEGVPVPSSELLRTLRDTVQKGGRTWRSPAVGEHRRLGAASLIVHHPPAPDWERQKVRNDDSLVLELRIGRVSILLPGDVGQNVEMRLVPRLERDRIWIVKMPHHGSRSSSTVELIARLRPVAAVASAGRANPYGHPSPDVLGRYESAGAMVFRTDRDGAITLWTNGENVWMEAVTGKRLVTLSSSLPPTPLPAARCLPRALRCPWLRERLRSRQTAC